MKVYGDADFPRSALGDLNISPVAIFKDLFQTFSRLNFTFQSNRPYAIRGLESRLHRELQCEGIFGIVAGKSEYIGQSLLWRRAAASAVPRANFRKRAGRPPSWSWLAYAGEIGYLDIRQGEVEWDAQISIVDSSRSGTHGKTYLDCRLSAPAWKFREENILEACYDYPDSTIHDDLKCVIVGRGLEANGTPSTYYLLLVAKIGAGHPWVRLGVAIAKGKGLVLEDSREVLRIA